MSLLLIYLLLVSSFLHKVEGLQIFVDCFVLRHNRISHGLLQKQITAMGRSNLDKHSKMFKTFLTYLMVFVHFLYTKIMR